jgi:hypothetical protein
MFSGFNLKIDIKSFTKDKYPKSYQTGKDLFSSQRIILESQVKLKKLADGSIDGAALEREWFPQIDADIFLSHSHLNEETAFVLAGFLKNKLDLVTFIDSAVWGYSPNLLKEIDNVYCYNEKNGTYDYDKRNGSTSHVHLMLAGSLSKMIDNCECIIFLNTPSSIRPDEVIQSTISPWIYTEISTTRLIRKREPEKHSCRINRLKKGLFSERSNKLVYENLIITHQVELSHLRDLTEIDLVKWINHGNKKEFNLDKLYEMTSILKD